MQNKNMRKNTQKGSIGIIVAIIAIVLIGGGILYSKTTEQSDPKKDVMMEDGTLMKAGEHEKMMVDEEMMKKDDASVVKGEIATAKAGTYEAYAPEKIAKASTGKVVLFFHASWCSTCRTLTNDITNNLKLIPEHVTILDVDYDTSSALKQKYKVTTQHTLVQVDAKGNQIKQWKGSPTLAALIAEL